MKTEQQLDQAISELAREFKPSRDLWADIEPALQDRPAPARWYQAATARRWAAVLALALVGTLWWSRMDIPQPGQVSPDASIATSGQSSVMQQLPAEVLIVSSYEQIKAQQLGELAYVSPDVGDWQYQLSVWDQAISQVRGALQYYPEEPFLLAQMQGLYQQQLEYLQTISAVEPNHIWTGSEL